ncbi:MAG: cytidylate kinase-like family protein [Desulfarculaceae bacterium]|nr:cytidylate kinase-like family protein [Desulfarculaceae bacterium]MCF8072149.1 cytidylate kinase-like family protein [Desulfarculaceae bacterium]MCF8100070.1 cytidylate kinase-like family protein [Desulfarculaceae bacterium]MCF8118277.1 cytidylate kinase-like family protein [Desulfarculaceae bacterium]
MAIITISRGSYSKGREVAEKVAQRLGYDVVSRDVLLEASEHFHIPEVKLVRAIHDAPSILDRFSHGRYCYLAFFQSALADRAAADNLVYHGLAGHLLLKGVPHVLKVRIIADLEARVAAEMERENLTQNQARDILIKDDEERRKWTQNLYGVDPWDASLYDLVIHIHQLSVDDAVDFIAQAAERQCFQTTPDAQQKMDDLALACRVKTALIQDDCVDVAVACEFGNVLVYSKQGHRRTHQLEEKVKPLAAAMPEINHIEVRTGQAIPPEAC